MIPLPPPPRAVEALYPHVVLKAILWVVFVAAVPATIFFIGAAVDAVFVQTLGREVTARVISAREYPDKLLGGYSRSATYAYTLPDGRERTDDAAISWAEWHRLSMPHITPKGRPEQIVFTAEKPAEMTVRAYAIGPLANSRAKESAWGGGYLPIVSAVTVVLAFLLLALWLFLVTRPRRYERLYTHGVAVPGQIVNRRKVYRSKIGLQYFVYYTFEADGTGQRVMTVRTAPTVKEFNAAEPGRAVTVLHEPGNPRFSVVYEYGGYRCTGLAEVPGDAASGAVTAPRA